MDDKERRQRERSAPENAPLSNAEIAGELTSLAQLLAAQGENRFKVKAYRRAAKTIMTLGESVDELVRSDADLTAYPGIGNAIGGAVREIVRTGTLGQVDAIRSQVSPEVAAISEHSKLDPKRVLRVYKKLNISSIAELKERLDSGEVAARLGLRMDQHIRQALSETHEMLLYDADRVAAAVETFLRGKCGVSRAEATGEYRRRVEVVGEISFLIEADDFPGVLSKLERYGGRAKLLSASDNLGRFRLPSGAVLKVQAASNDKWGVALIASTGSDGHLRELAAKGCKLEELANSNDSYSTEASVYRSLGLSFIEPELREGHDEVQRAARSKLPRLVSREDIRGELHAHSTSSDGANTIEQMAAAARKRGYEYIGISDHSQSLKIAGGLQVNELWDQIRYIDKLNERLDGIRVLKSAEVDILADGSLDYPDEVLKELDYTVCSIHSRFSLGWESRTDRTDSPRNG